MAADLAPAVPARRMTSAGLVAWALERPEGHRYELVVGEVVGGPTTGMAAERLPHARAKARVRRALADAISRAGLPCEALPDGVAVEVSADVVYEPDALVRCGRRRRARTTPGPRIRWWSSRCSRPPRAPGIWA